MTTNANSPIVAKTLAVAKHGTFTSLITRKQGTTRGKGCDKKVFGDDLVQTLLVTGFDYGNLVQKSLDGLAKVVPADVIASAAKKGTTLDEATVLLAIDELRASFMDSLDGSNCSTTDHVYEPLVVDGGTVQGARVYKCAKDTGKACHCRTCTGDEKAPLDGTVYLQGIRIWTKVLEAAKNGPVPPAKSAPKTVAKDIVRFALPVGKYVSYRLEPKTEFMLRAGGSAVIESTEKGFMMTDEVFAVLAA
jgi:hypothetical protein